VSAADASEPPCAVTNAAGSGISQCADKVPGHTKSMKTAISIPDDVFEGAERLARRTKKSRSQL